MHGHDSSDHPVINLPLSDPLCSNDSCPAFAAAGAESQAQISWASQFQYGLYTVWFYVCVLAPFAFLHLRLKFLSFWRGRHLGQGRYDGGATESASMGDKLVAAMRSVTYRRFRGRWGSSLPSFGVLGLVCASVIAAAAFAFAQRPYYRERRGYGSPPLAIRTGLMAAALVPFTIALGGKVNLVTWLTGYGHEKLNVFHRYVAYILLVLSIVHTVPFLVAPLKEGGASALHEQYYSPGSFEYTGTPPFVLLVFLAMFSVPPIRRRFYELFVQTHILGAVVFLGLSFWHFGNLLDSWHYLWATLGVWLLSLLGRFFWKASAFRLAEPWFSGYPTTVQMLAGNMVKLRVLAPARWRWQPGQHVFIRFPSLGVLENHPFTIASIPADDLAAAGGTTSCVEKGVSRSERHAMTLLIRPHDGFTRKLGHYAELSNEKRSMLSAVVEGPYGTIIPSLHERYDNAILVAGGGGITACVPWLLHLSEHMRTSEAGEAQKQSPLKLKNVKLFWMVKEAAVVEWVDDEIAQACKGLHPDSVHIHLFVTQQQGSPESSLDSTGRCDSESSNPEEKGAVARVSNRSSRLGSIDSRYVKVSYSGRPDIGSLVSGNLRHGRTSVIGCGPESLKVDLSNAVAKAQSKTWESSSDQVREVSLHTESFGW